MSQPKQAKTSKPTQRFKYYNEIFYVDQILKVAPRIGREETYNAGYDIQLIVTEGEYRSLNKEWAINSPECNTDEPLLVVDFGPGYRRQVIDGIHRIWKGYATEERVVFPALVVNYDDIQPYIVRY